MDGARAMTAGKYDVLLFAEHDLYGPALEPKHQMHDQMCVTNKGTMTRLSYNTNNGPRTEWNQYGDIGFIINTDMRTRMTQNGWGSDLTKLRQMDVDENRRKRWNCYCLCFSMQTMSQPRWHTYGIAAAS